MSTTKIRAFLAVAQCGSFSAAARLLGVSQPTLTTQVQWLEKQHGVQLFIRRGHRIELTDVGLRLLPIARKLSALEVEAASMLHDSGQLNAGHLKLGAVSPFHAIEMVDTYLKRYPLIKISIKVGNSGSVFKDLEEYAVDLAVLARFHEAEGYEVIPYARDAVALCVNAKHPFASRDKIDIRELEGERLLQRESGSVTRRALEQAAQNAGVRLAFTMEIGSREALREAVIRGIGIGAVSEGEYSPDPQLRLVHFSGEPVWIETCLYCLKERRSSLLLNSFIEVVQELRGKPVRERGGPPPRQ